MTADATYTPVRKSENIADLAAALAKAQGEIKNAPKTNRNTYFKSDYADLGENWNSCRGPLSRNGLALVQFPTVAFLSEPKFREYKTKDGDTRVAVDVICRVRVTTGLYHCSGQFMEEDIESLLGKGDPQSIGSAVTYLRRYALAPMVGVAPADDDDGNAASHANGEVNHGQEEHPSEPPPPALPALTPLQLAEAVIAKQSPKDQANWMRIRGYLLEHSNTVAAYAAARQEVTQLWSAEDPMYQPVATWLRQDANAHGVRWSQVAEYKPEAAPAPAEEESEVLA